MGHYYDDCADLYFVYGLVFEEKEMSLYRALVANPHVPGQPFGVGTAELIVVSFIILIIYIIVRRLVSFKR